MKKKPLKINLRAAAESLHRRAMRRGASVKFSGLSDNELAAKLRDSGDALLSSPEWKALRKKMLERHGAKCMKCGRVPKILSQINIDHIKPRRFFPELAMDENNLQVLCGRCNKAKGNKHMTDYRMVAA